LDINFFNMLKKKLAFFALLGAGLLLATNPVLGAVKSYQNDLPQKDWVKYGVNPWSLDTDNDGYTDAWEVKSGYCPTNYNKGVMLDSGECVKGKINLKNKIYTAPTIIQNNLPREIKKVKSCADLQTVLKTQSQNVRSKEVYGFNNLGSVDLGIDFAAPTGLGSAESVGILGATSVSASAGSDYSSTNIQVEGVDESDLVKPMVNIFIVYHLIRLVIYF